MQIAKTIPAISVIMGIYNTKNKEEVKRSLESIKNQSFKDWECIICEDGSTDDTYEFLKNFVKNDSRFVIVRNNQNSGLAFSLNHALENAKGEYIVRQDADDYSVPERFERLYNYMSNHLDVDVLGTGMKLFDSDGVWGSYKIRTKEAKKTDFLMGTVVAHPSVIMKAQKLRECDGYRISKETRRCEDYDLFMRMFANGCKICNIEDELYYYASNRNGVKRKFKNVLNESIVRRKGFRLLGLGPKRYLFIIKPIVIYFMPKNLVKKLREDK